MLLKTTLGRLTLKLRRLRHEELSTLAPSRSETALTIVGRAPALRKKKGARKTKALAHASVSALALALAEP